MANNLTGDFDAVLLIRVKKINALLATLHQNGADEDASPTFPHSVTTRVGDQPKIGHLPPSAFEPRGIVRVQLSAPAISLPPGSTSEVTVHVHARAHYTGNPGTLALPEPVHGEVRATCSVTVKSLETFGSAKKILEVNLPQEDSKIQFHPAQGISLSPIDFAQLLALIRKVVREGFEPVNTELPEDFPFRQFKELGGGQVLALPISLTPGVEPPAQALNTVTNNFLMDDFSIAISKEFVERQLQPTIDRLLAFRTSFSNWWTTYHVRVTSVPPLEWNNGSITLIVRATAKAPRAPDYGVTIRQRLTLVLKPLEQRILLGARNADLEVSLSGLGSSFVRGRVRSAIIEERDDALPLAEDLINDRLTGEDGARPRINDGLKSIDKSAGAFFGAVRVTPDGLILDGRISTKNRSGVSVAFKETSDGSGFTALESWIPGGRIERFDWSWIFQNPITIWGQQVAASSETHRFTLPRPSPPPAPPVIRLVLGDVCLRIVGVQVDSQGNEILVSGGEICSISTPEVAWRVPPGMETLVVPVWLPDVAPDAILDEAIAAHVNVLADPRPARGTTANSLVHFADPRMDRPLNALGEALARARQKNAPFLAAVVVSPGTFTGRRREVEARLGSIGEDFWGHLVLTEDYTGGWNRAFGPGDLPATFLLNGQGDVVWKQAGMQEGEALAKAIDEHFASGRTPKFRRLHLASLPCERAPRALLTDDRGQSLALRKLRGHRVLLNFWQSWSAPCIQELRRLQALHEKGGEGAPVIVAVNGGEKAEVLSEVRRKYNLAFALVHDPERKVAREFGIECWPTTVSINAEGRAEGVQFGILREPRTDDRRGTVQNPQPKEEPE
jgi:thiol-disulfide isomerase/thioredoxin